MLMIPTSYFILFLAIFSQADSQVLQARVIIRISNKNWSLLSNDWMHSSDVQHNLMIPTNLTSLGGINSIWYVGDASSIYNGIVIEF